MSGLGRCLSYGEAKKMTDEHLAFWGGVCLIQTTKTRENLRFLFKKVVSLLKVFIKRQFTVIRHISSSITSLYSIPKCIILAILQIWSSIWCFSHLAI